MLASGRNGTLSTGATSDLAGRVVQHREEPGASFPSRYAAKRLVWFALGDDMEAAIAHEKRTGRWRRAWKVQLVEQCDPHREDLAIGLGLPPLPSSS